MKLKMLKPRIQTQGNRLPVMQQIYPGSTARDRGRPWRRRRAAWLRAHPLCCICQSNGYVTAATEVDHRIPLWMGGADDESNYQSLCSEDHKAKTAIEATERLSLGIMSKY